MLRFVLFDLGMFASGDDQARAQKDLCWMLEALTQRNQSYLNEHPDTPPLYSAGVRYAAPAQNDPDSVPEVRILRGAIDPRKARDPEVQRALQLMVDALGGERFRDIPRIIENGVADCDNWLGWRTAELRHAGIPASPYLTSRQRPDGGTTMHAIVRWPDGSSEDPSRLLGMGGDSPDAIADRREEQRKNDERRATAAWKIRSGVESGLISREQGDAAMATLLRILPPATSTARVAGVIPLRTRLPVSLIGRRAAC